MLLYTDGLTEIVNKMDPVKNYYETKMMSDIMELEHLDCRHFMEGMTKKIIEYRGSEVFEDDICMICFDIV